MSNIVFNSRAGRVLVHGSERHHLLAEINQLARNTPTGAAAGPIPGIPQLNAVLGMGTDIAIFVARISAQCELTCWVDGPHRAWIAGIIGSALGTGILRAGMGWEGAQHLLLQGDAEPVFIGCTQGPLFPDIDGHPFDEAQWEALGDEGRWQWAELHLRAESDREDESAHLAAHPTEYAAPFSRELRPCNWHQYFFADSVNY